MLNTQTRRSFFLGLGIGALALLAMLLAFWGLKSARSTRQNTSEPGWEKNFIGAVLPTVRNKAGDVVIGQFPYAGNVKIRLASMGRTMDVSVQTPDTNVTNATLVEFEVTSECNVFIKYISCDVEFLDSWGKVIAAHAIGPRDIKPFGREVIHERVLNLPRQKLHTWRMHDKRADKNSQTVFRPLANIQRVEGSNDLAEVTLEVWQP